MSNPSVADAERPSFVVIGTSAGGENALVQVFRSLPSGFPGAVLVVIHVGTNRDLGWLAEHLTRAGQLTVKIAEDGEPIEQGAAYLAPAARLRKDRAALLAKLSPSRATSRRRPRSCRVR